MPNVQVIYEPFSRPYHTTNPIEVAAPKEKHTYEDAIIKLLKDYPGKEAVFAKSIALYVRDRFDMLLDDAFKSFNHSFLIRNPTCKGDLLLLQNRTTHLQEVLLSWSF